MKINLRILLLASMLMACSSVYAQNNTVPLTIDVQKQGNVISPMLFGHNLEHTRKTIGQGISAEMVANRKFAAVDGGMPLRWHSLNGKGIAVDNNIVYTGKNSVKLENGNGIWQEHDWLAFEKGRKYVFRVWVKSDTPQTLTMRVANRPGFAVLFNDKYEVKDGDWQLWSGEFTASVDAKGANLTLTNTSKETIFIGAVSMMPADNFHGMRRDVIDLFKQLKPASLRWPGGCFAEYYHWKDGLLPIDKRPPIGPHRWRGLLLDTDGYDNHDIGTDEFIALCRELNCQPVLTTRFGGGGDVVEEAASWVEYCNGGKETQWGKVRAERGFEEPYNVKYWYVGNEVQGMSLVANKSPQVCIALLRKCAEAMREKDATLKLSAGVMADRNWNEQLFKENNGLFDMVQDGFYFSPNDHITLDKVLANPAEKSIQSLRNFIDTKIPNGKQLGLCYYEWNVMWDRTGNAVSGIFAAQMLNMLCREQEALKIESANYFQPITEGAIRVTPTGCSLDADGQVFALFAAHQNNHLLNIGEASVLSDLDICASVSKDKKRVFITILNRNANEEKTLDLSLKNFVSSAEAVTHTLTPTSLQKESSLIEKEEKIALSENNHLILTIPRCGIVGIML